MFEDEEAGPVGKEEIILGKALLDGGRGRNDEDGAGPKSECKDGAMGDGEAVEGAVEWFFEEVEVAYYGKGRGAWRWVFGWGLGFEEV